MTYQWIGATAYGGPQSFVDRIVMHATVSGCSVGEAAANARYLQQVGLSAHYLVDPDQVVQMLDEHTIGYHDGHNVNEIGIELCDPQAGPASRWTDAPHQQMLARAAELVAGIAGRWNVPMSRIRADLRVAPTRGITGHVEVTNTWHESTHQDPDVAGPFPWDSFIAAVTGGTAPTPAPPTGDLSMADAASLSAQITALQAQMTALDGKSDYYYQIGEYGGDPTNAADRHGWRPGRLQLLTALSDLAAKIGQPATVQVDAPAAQQIGNQILAALGPALGAQVADHIQITVTGK